MTRKLIKIAAALSVSVASLATVSAPASARDGWDNGRHYGQYKHGRDRDYRGDRYYGGRDNYYRGNNYYRSGYRGDNYRCRDKGTGGAIIGAIAGGLLGHEIAGRGDRTTGTVIGGALGAVTGHVIDKSDGRPC
ncbi:hypothetical protein FHS92_002866 [Sphingobium subterraneum]|uniref:17 kDa surface antigen n=2 Tax=Sphingobium subterraneum TaxID=627688 RepID=A0A841J1Q2_9SPHN|nr:glycine zipper 2TM domain-containing protein [Sphingobium subterraneum]MBB6125109.1 hypothetical protein [Sphingobium subterraneum]